MAAAAVLLPMGCKKALCVARDPKLEDQIFDVAGRLRLGLVKENVLTSKTQRNGVDVFYPRKSKFRGGLPICRVVKAQINAPLDEISAMWKNQDSRIDWDKSVTDSQILQEDDSETFQTYFEGKAGYIASARGVCVGCMCYTLLYYYVLCYCLTVLHHCPSAYSVLVIMTFAPPLTDITCFIMSISVLSTPTLTTAVIHITLTALSYSILQ